MYILNETHPVVYFGKIFESERSKAMFKYFKDNIEWNQDIYFIGGREIKSPRLTAMYSQYGNINYTYSGQTKKSYKYNKGIRYISEEIEKKLNLEKGYLNGCLLNLYRDGNDSISYHKDNEKDMIEDGIICILSLGAERFFHIKKDTTKEHIKYLLEDQSLVIMNPICQKEWKHGINKEKKVTNPRISLTFRNFKEQ